jgi:hypothetical protein
VKKRILAVTLLLTVFTPHFAFADFKAEAGGKATGSAGIYTYEVNLNNVLSGVLTPDKFIHIYTAGGRQSTPQGVSPADDILTFDKNSGSLKAGDNLITLPIFLESLQSIHNTMCDHENGACILTGAELTLRDTAGRDVSWSKFFTDSASMFSDYTTFEMASELSPYRDIIMIISESVPNIAVYGEILDRMDGGNEALIEASVAARELWTEEIKEEFNRLPDKSVATAGDWRVAAQAYTAGIEGAWTPSEFPTDSFETEEIAIISAIYASPFSVGTETLQPRLNWPDGTPLSTLEPLLPSYTEEFRKVSADYLEGGENLIGRMITYPSRVQFLTVKAKTMTGDEQGLLEISDYVRNTAYKSSLWPALAGFSTEHLKYWRDGEAYTLLLATLSEVDAYRQAVISVLGPTLADNRTTFAKELLTGVMAVKEGLDYINSADAWELWRKPYTDTEIEVGEYDTLEKIYNRLLEMQAFDGINTYDVSELSEPLRRFFSLGDKKLSSDLLQGVALSSMYIPAHTNMYDPTTIKLYEPEDEADDFNRKYAFNRKALYIDTNSDAAMQLTRTNQKGGIRVATLNDLMFAEKDIVLYLDDNLYNVRQLAELQNKAMNRLDNVDSESDTQGLLGKFWDWATDVFNMSIYELAKTAEEVLYSTRPEVTVMPYRRSAETDATTEETYEDYYVLPSKAIDTYLNEDNYTFMQSFAATSAVYRHPDLKTQLNTWLRGAHPVFVSSPNLPFITEAGREEHNTVYNYLLLKNLEPNMPIGYATNLDMNSPLYMDIYGNILTESGTVIIPAASNATLHKTAYSPYNAGLLSTYGDAYKLEVDETATAFNKTISEFFEEDANTGCWELKSIKSMDGEFDAAMLSTGSKDTLEALRDMYAYDLDAGKFKFDLAINNVVEVLRGAPLEEIDKNEEGLNVNRRLSKRGIIAAAKLEEFAGAFGQRDINTVLALPNLAYIDGLEYIILFTYKIIVLVMLVIWMITIYLDAVGQVLSWRTPLKCMSVLLLVVSLIIIVPATFELTYYQSNKWMLQKEAGYLQMLNLEKREKGVEIGVTEIQEPDTTTKLLLKMDDIRYHWYDLFGSILTSSTFDSLEQIYKEYNESSEIIMAEGMEVMNDAVYMSADELFKSTDIMFQPVAGTIFQYAGGDTEASFYTPYYAFLDVLLYRVNSYNSMHKTYAYTTTVQSAGKVKTLGLIGPFLNSVEFMQEDVQDVLSLKSVYGYEEAVWFSESDVKAMQGSQWCNTKIDQEQVIKRIELISQHAREYVNENRNLIGRVTDETFLKSMALDLAMFHNRVFNTQRADTLEMYKFSNEDLLRLAIAPKDEVMRNSPMSFARFVYECGGTVTVYAVSLLLLVMLVGSWLKPLATIAIFLLVFSSLFVYKIILRNKTKGYLGYIITIGAVCGMNIFYSVLLKLSVYLPNAGLPTTVCIILQIVLQVLYLFLLSKIVVMAISDWKNMGFVKHLQIADNIALSKIQTPIRKHVDGWKYYQELKDSQEARVRGKKPEAEKDE